MVIPPKQLHGSASPVNLPLSYSYTSLQRHRSGQSDDRYSQGHAAAVLYLEDAVVPRVTQRNTARGAYGLDAKSRPCGGTYDIHAHH